VTGTDRGVARSSKKTVCGGLSYALLVGTLLLTALGSKPAHALPSYARQTGQQCAACHNGFPELTPYGRLFKLNGYTFTGGTSNIPPLAMMAVPEFHPCRGAGSRGLGARLRRQ